MLLRYTFTRKIWSMFLFVESMGHCKEVLNLFFDGSVNSPCPKEADSSGMLFLLAYFGLSGWKEIIGVLMIGGITFHL